RKASLYARKCRHLERSCALAAFCMRSVAGMIRTVSLECVEAERYRDAMRRVPAAVTIVTTQFEHEANGLTATAVCSVTADPPQVLVCVNREATAESLIAKSRRFVVNFLSEEHEDRARRFSQS